MWEESLRHNRGVRMCNGGGGGMEEEEEGGSMDGWKQTAKG